jgi:hypothetical protein
VREFFRGWRRKAGLMTLAMALLLMVAWTRSYSVYSMLGFAVGGRQFMVQAGTGYVRWSGWSSRTAEPLISAWQTLTLNEDHERALIVRQLAIDGSEDSVSWLIPYWSLVLPLTLLSAWLLLSKSRAANSAKEANRACLTKRDD